MVYGQVERGVQVFAAVHQNISPQYNLESSLGVPLRKLVTSMCVELSACNGQESLFRQVAASRDRQLSRPNEIQLIIKSQVT